MFFLGFENLCPVFYTLKHKNVLKTFRRLKKLFFTKFVHVFLKNLGHSGAGWKWHCSRSRLQRKSSQTVAYAVCRDRSPAGRVVLLVCSKALLALFRPCSKRRTAA